MNPVAGHTPNTTVSQRAPVSVVGLQPRSVAVLRALQLGDLLCSVPALRALRAALPDARVTLVGLRWAREFVSRFKPYVNDFIELPGFPGLPECPPDLGRMPAFLAAAQQRRFDLVVQMHGSGEITNPLALLLGGATTVGFYRPGHYCPDETCFLPYPDSEPELRRPLTLLQQLGVPARGEYLEFPIEDADREAAHQATGSRLRANRYVCVHPGSRSVGRRWSPEAFARVADAIASRGLQIVLTGSAAEGRITQAVASHMHAAALDLAGRTELGALAAIIAGARLVVCNDTGVSHIADALAVPSVVAFTGSDPQRWAPLDRSKHRVVRASAGAESDGAVPPIERAISEAQDLLRAEGRYAA